ncbi:hypothetical protein [Streptomyces sp. NPDC052701]|uniref:hypothetical protein n=1 Tax=Streptomyces sp. NPDC052701 TaxID=3155533 RepID=UPI00341C6604
MSEQDQVCEPVAHRVGVFLTERREQIAQRRAGATLFRTVFTVSRDEAVEACRATTPADAPADALAHALGRLREGPPEPAVAASRL